MLQSSLGFHTMTLYMSLSMHNAQQLIMDFNTYRKNTGLIEMYRINERNKIVKYYPKEYLMPLETNIYFKDRDRGIKWCIRSPECPSNSSIYIIEVTINPKILAGIADYLTAANYYDMNITIINFNDNSKKISSLLGTFNE